MKKYLVLTLICLLALPLSGNARKKYRSDKKSRHAPTVISIDEPHGDYRYRSYSDVHCIYHRDHMCVDMDDGSLFIFNLDSDDEVEITETYELLLNGDPIEISEKQKALLKEFTAQTLRLDSLTDDMDTRTEGIVDIERAVKYRAAQHAYIATRSLPSIVYLDDDMREDLVEDIEELLEDIEEDREESTLDAEELEELIDNLTKNAREVEREAKLLEDKFVDILDAIPELDDIDWY
ncbi:MAG: hypothetical protein R3F48_16730 [Candidatus Zixiibacteriota bacterium]